MQTSTHNGETTGRGTRERPLPRSLAALRKAWRQVVADSVGNGEDAAARVAEIHEEAQPHQVGCRIREVQDVNVKGSSCTLTVRISETGRAEDKNELMEVDPRVGALYCRRSATDRLERHLLKADEAGDWTRATAVAEAILLVLRTEALQDTGERSSETQQIKTVRTGRLDQVDSELADAIRSEVQRSVRAVMH